MNSNIFFSVIIPTFNRGGFLLKSINSVLTQSYKSFEVIVVDDGSTDHTKEAVLSIKDERIVYVSQTNKGPSAARNKGLEVSSGDHVAFLDSDDIWRDDKLMETVRYVRSYPDTKIFHTEETWYRNGILLQQRPKHKKPDGYVYPLALPLCCISISTAVIERSVFEDVGDFDETFEACEDYDLWLRITSKYAVKLIPLPLTSKDGGRPDQLSSSVWGLDRFRIKALQKMISSGGLSTKHKALTISEMGKKCRIFANGADKRGKHEVASHYRGLLRSLDEFQE